MKTRKPNPDDHLGASEERFEQEFDLDSLLNSFAHKVGREIGHDPEFDSGVETC